VTAEKKLGIHLVTPTVSFIALTFLLQPQPAFSDDSSGETIRKEAPKVVAGFTVSEEAPDGNRFLGSEGCAPCHEKEYNGWKKTFHSTAVQDVRSNPSAILADLNSDEDLPFTRQDIEYTIGSHWDQRYMTHIDGEYYILPRLWSVQSKEWRPYSVWSWKRKPYSRYCAGCHTTYIDPVKRTIGDDDIGCEACHGPGGRHVEEKGDPSFIVNPADLSIERYNMICASCHVRGTDRSGEYYYPVGYMPGKDLTDYYIPLEMKEGEPVRGALSRLYRDWKEKKLNSSQARCEVCGIAGTGKDDFKGYEDDIMNFCFSCHNYKDKLQLHTHHSVNVKQICTDCHVPKAKSLKDNLEGDIHSYSYFLVHNENCYDSEIEKACVSCHTDISDAVSWAKGIIRSWGKPVIVDH
jgi:hypothetical protein